MILRYSLYFCNNSNNAAILLPLRASKRQKSFIYGLFHECEIIPTRSRKPPLKQFCIGDLACGIIVICIIHKLWTVQISVVICCHNSFAFL